MTMITRDQLEEVFRNLPSRGQPVIVHGSYKALRPVDGGPSAVIEALVRVSSAVVAPAFTYDTMINPLVGPPNNALDYDAEEARRLELELDPDFPGPARFRANLPVDQELGILPETLRRRADAQRSSHPILSFAGVNADFALERQTLFEPFAPIGALAEKNGWVLLIGVDHKVNTSIHYAERLAGRKQFTRWALTDNRIVECRNFPGDSFGFEAIRDAIVNYTDVLHIGSARIEAIPLNRLIATVIDEIKKDPQALLCQRITCMRCRAVRDSL